MLTQYPEFRNLCESNSAGGRALPRAEGTFTARVKALRPRACAYDIRDEKLRGFGVRILPSGAGRFFIHIQHRGQRIWKIVDDASVLTVDESRARAASTPVAIRRDTDAPASPDATRFEAVAETVFRRYARVWKPQTLYVNRNYLHRNTSHASRHHTLAEGVPDGHNRIAGSVGSAVFQAQSQSSSENASARS